VKGRRDTPGAESIFRITHGYWSAKAVLTAARLDVFSAIGSRERTASQVAATLKLDPRGTELLLNALAGLSLLTKQGERFANAPVAARFLVNSSPEHVGPMLWHQDNQWAAWGRLAEVVRVGKPVSPDRAPADERAGREADSRREFTLAMHVNSLPRARRLAKRLDLRGRRHLIDVGGGAGTFAVEFCRRHRSLAATVLDRPETRRFARDLIRQSGMQQRMRFVGGDFNETELGGPYDVALLSNVIHSEGPVNVQGLFARVFDALLPGGLIVVVDFFLDPARTRPTAASLFALNMLVHSDAGRSYSAAETRAWLRAAGFKRCRFLRGALLPPQRVITAQKV